MNRLTKNDLADKSRYQFKTEDVDLPELGGSVAVKTLSVKERDALPDMTDENGKPKAGVRELSGTVAAIVVDPKMSEQEWFEILGDLPAAALDRILEAFGELLGTKEDHDRTVREFPSTDGDS